MTKEEKQYVLDALQFALDNGTFENAEHSYNTLANAINVIDNEPTSEGWIKINSEDDLPKDGTVFWVMKKKYNYPIIERFYHKDAKYWADEFTHYQSIQKPSLPIY